MFFLRTNGDPCLRKREIVRSRGTVSKGSASDARRSASETRNRRPAALPSFVLSNPHSCPCRVHANRLQTEVSRHYRMLSSDASRTRPGAGPLRHSEERRLGSRCPREAFPRSTHQNPPVASAAASSATSRSPRFMAGRLLHYLFRGLHSVHFRYGLQTHQVTNVTLYTRGVSSFVTSTTAPIATGRSEPVPGWNCPRCGPAPFHGAHEYQVTGC
jgi:hypothetical protein